MVPATMGALDFPRRSPNGSTMTNQHQTSSIATEAVIVGGGLVGLTLALALAKGGIASVVIDALDPAKVTGAGFDGRVSAIAYASCRMFRTLNIWDHLNGQVQPINDIVVSDSRGPRATKQGAASPFFLHFDHREIGDEPLGHLIENRHIRLAQQAAVEAEPLITLIAPQTVRGVDVAADGVTATLGDGRTVTGKVCYACDGRGSPLREAQGIKTISWGYKQTGIVTTVEHERPHNGVAQEYFMPVGPFAILPMTGNRSSLVWTEPTDLAPAFMALDDAAFAEEVAARFGDYLGKTKPVGPRWSYPLTLQLAREYVRPRLALVGDAAHGIHPIAGQGLNLGLRDVAVLAEIATDTARVGLDIGDLTALKTYERWRRFDNVALAAGTDVLTRLFSNDIGPLRMVRDLGLGIVNEIPPLRRVFMRHAGGALAMGGDENLPRLLRGEAL